MVIESFNKYVTRMEELSGLLGVNFIGMEKGNLLHNVSISGLNYKDAVKFEAEIVKNALQAIKHIQGVGDDALRQIIVSNQEQTHIMYISNDFSYIIHLIAEARINFGLLNIAHKEASAILEKEVSLEVLQKELFPSEAPKKVSHFKSMFFS